MQIPWPCIQHLEHQFYIDGLTPSVARVLNVLDKERLDVASSLGIHVHTALEWLKMSYGVKGADLRDSIRTQSGYRCIKAPDTLYHRYLFDDIPMGLVPIASIGRHYGVSVPTMESIIQLGSVVNKTNY